MKDLPFFTTQFGVASLSLSQIPLKKEAYIRIQQTQDPEQLLQECCSFCRAVGAERIYASGCASLDQYPVHTDIIQMECLRSNLSNTDAQLCLVTNENLSRWLEIYNQHMLDVPNAKLLTHSQARKICESGNAYYIYGTGTLLGIGSVSENVISSVVSVVPGCGREVVLALNRVLTGDIAVVEVASKNLRAIKLYEKLGFCKTKELSHWYRIM